MNDKERNFYLNLHKGLSVELASIYDIESLLETYSSFGNTCGGIIYLGIEEGRPNKLVGVNNPQKIKKDFFAVLDNRDKVSKNILSEDDFRITETEPELYIMEIHIPEADIYDKPIYLNSNIVNTYKRNYEGNFKVNQLELISLINDAKVLSYDLFNNKLNAGFNAVDKNTLKLFRKDLNNANPNNIFKDDNDEEFLVKAGYLNEKDGKYVLNNAGFLLFSSPAYIKRINPAYFLDYQEKIDEDSETWINRITTDDLDFTGNLYSFYLRVITALLKDLPKPFYPEEIKDTGEDNIMFMIREGFLNAITNCDFTGNNALKIIKTRSKIIFRNAGRLRIPYSDAVKYGNTDLRNKFIMSTFRNLKVCERVIDIPKIFKISEKLKLYKPVLTEDYVNNFTKLTVYLKVRYQDNNKIDKVLDYFARNNEFISIASLACNININRTTVSNIVNELVNDGILITNNFTTKGKKVKLK